MTSGLVVRMIIRSNRFLLAIRAVQPEPDKLRLGHHLAMAVVQDVGAGAADDRAVVVPLPVLAHLPVEIVELLLADDISLVHRLTTDGLELDDPPVIVASVRLTDV